jgi:hypothetical protein
MNERENIILKSRYYYREGRTLESTIAAECFKFGMSEVLISVTTKIIRSILQSLYANDEIEPKSCFDRFLPHSSQFITHYAIILFDIILAADHSSPRGLRHELSSFARTVGSWVRIPFKPWTFGTCVCVYSLFVLSCI